MVRRRNCLDDVSDSAHLMTPVDENPYAPPGINDPIRDAPRSRGWELLEGKLLVQPDAVLPMVDPFSGETAERMTMIRISLRPRVLWPRFLFFGSVGLMILAGWTGFTELTPVLNVSVIVGLLAILWFAFSGGTVLIYVFLTAKTRTRRRLYYWIPLGTIVISYATMALVPRVSEIPPEVGITLVWVLLAALGAFMLARVFSRRIYFRKAAPARFEIRGLHRRAMTELAGISARSSAQ